MLWLTRLAYRALFRITGNLPLRIISDDGRPYLERYYLGQLAGRCFYIHRFVGSDPHRGLHDHPWRAVSFVLWGEYGEERAVPNARSWRLRQDSYEGCHRVAMPVRVSRVRWWNRLGVRDAHRVVIGDDWGDYVSPQDAVRCTSRSPECWSLFVHKRRTSAWGFWQVAARLRRQPPLRERDLCWWRWQPFDNHLGLTPSGDWWNTALHGNVNPKRVPPLTDNQLLSGYCKVYDT